MTSHPNLMTSQGAVSARSLHNGRDEVPECSGGSPGSYAEASSGDKKEFVRSVFMDPDPDTVSAALVAGSGADAINEFEKLLKFTADPIAAMLRFASQLGEHGRVEEAHTIFERVVSQDTNNIEAWNALGQCAAALHDVKLTARYRQRAFDIDPRSPLTLKHYLCDLLRSRNFRDAQRIYRQYWRELSVFAPPRAVIAPQWDGVESLEHKTFVLHAAQIGFGDVFQFIRFVPLLKQRGARVLVYAHRSANSLLARVEGIDRILQEGELPQERVDFEAELFSFWLMFDLDVIQVAEFVPYLSAPATNVQRCQKIVGENKSYRIGLVWRGSTAPVENPRSKRSAPLTALHSLANVPAVDFFSLQFDAQPSELDSWPGTRPLIDLSGKVQLFSFLDAVAAMQTLDLIITVDTAAAHLAGGAGRPTYLLLPYSACWRWSVECAESPWYPTMHLFRQNHPGDWKDVVASVRESIHQTASRLL
jgi:hypothetical protein